MLYDGTGCTIDTGNKDDIGIAVRASYVILRGFAIRNVKEHDIRLFSGRHILIEDCDISKRGSESVSSPRPAHSRQLGSNAAHFIFYSMAAVYHSAARGP